MICFQRYLGQGHICLALEINLQISSHGGNHSTTNVANGKMSFDIGVNVVLVASVFKTIHTTFSNLMSFCGVKCGARKTDK
jgi:hypothetical protein